MAEKRQLILHRKVDLEELVDMFLEDKLGDGSVYRTRDTGTQKDPKDIFGDVVSDGVPCNKELENIERIGRSLAMVGDELWSSRKVSELKGELQEEITKTGQLSEIGEVSPQDEERHWNRFKEILDKALEDIGPHNPYRMIAAVLVAVRGMSNFSRGVGILARRFTFRFFEERHLKRDIERAGGVEHLADEDLD